MRKLLSMALALVMVCSLSVTAFAATDGHGSIPSVVPDGGYSTTVTYTGQGTEEYTVTVPATLVPGGSGNVVVTGTWSSEKHLNISAPTSVSLANGGNIKTLAINFANGVGGVSISGSDTESINESHLISVANFADGQTPLFGTWIGTITYTVTLGANTPIYPI